MEERKVNGKGFKKGKAILLTVIILLLAGGLVLGGIVFINGAPERQVRKHMLQADNCFSEGDYNQAITAYEAVLRIDPKNVDAYLSLAKAYEKTDRLEEALETLEDGYDRTDNNRLARRIEKLEGQIREAADNGKEKSDPTEEQTEPSQTAQQEVPLEERYEDYFTTVLTGQYGIFETNKDYPMYYRAESYEGQEYIVSPDFDSSLHGILKHVVDDLDGDGKPELLVVRIENAKILYEVFEFDGKEIFVSASTTSMQAVDGYDRLGGNDSTDVYIYYTLQDGKLYLIADVEVSQYDAGGYWRLEILSYNGQGFTTEFAHDFSNDYDGTELETDVSALRRCGVNVNNGSYDIEEADFVRTSVLKTIVIIWADNPEYNSVVQRGEDGYYANVALDDYVLYRIYDDIESFWSATRIMGYRTWRDDCSTRSTTSDCVISAFFDEVYFFGNDSELIKWLNEKMESAARQYLNARGRTTTYVEGLEDETWGESWDDEPHKLKNVFFDDHYVSVAYDIDFYMGGVGGNWIEAYNYDLDTREEVSLETLTGLDGDDLADYIWKGVERTEGLQPGDDSYEYMHDYVAYAFRSGNYSFYLDKEQIFLFLYGDTNSRYSAVIDR